MSRAQNLLQTAARLLEMYKPGEPFHLYLKNYFARNKKHGSNDRRILRDLCYAYFRIGKNGSELATIDRVAAAYYLVSPDPMPLLGGIKSDWPPTENLTAEERAIHIGFSWNPNLLFPWQPFLSHSVEVDPFIHSLLQQPDLFIRIRPGHEKQVVDRLDSDGISFRKLGADCLALSNATSIETRFEIDGEIVVQDLSSQRIGELMRLLPKRDHWEVWDACAASGGKSILVYDVLKQITLSCTDVRGSMLRNLQNRLGRAQVPLMRLRTDDLTKYRDRSDWGSFDLILADVPCTGSGTWARTPEQSYYFDSTRIEEYVNTQRLILQQLSRQLSVDGYLLYMTCSVFAAENEQQVSWAQSALGLELIDQRIFAGYQEKADSLFGALFRRSA